MIKSYCVRKFTKILFAFILHDNRHDVQKNKKCIKFPAFIQRIRGQLLPDKFLHDKIGSMTCDGFTQELLVDVKERQIYDDGNGRLGEHAGKQVNIRKQEKIICMRN